MDPKKLGMSAAEARLRIRTCSDMTNMWTQAKYDAANAAALRLPAPNSLRFRPGSWTLA
jgi:hypothetical protein